jgi:hypothetical protein
MNSDRSGAEAGENIWGDLVIGVFFLGFAVYMYQDLVAFEASGGERSLNTIFALLYNGFGKWGVVIPIALVGAGFVWSFNRKRKRIRT